MGLQYGCQPMRAVEATEVRGECVPQRSTASALMRILAGILFRCDRDSGALLLLKLALQLHM